jgi:hypothetical protein
MFSSSQFHAEHGIKNLAGSGFICNEIQGISFSELFQHKSLKSVIYKDSGNRNKLFMSNSKGFLEFKNIWVTLIDVYFLDFMYIVCEIKIRALLEACNILLVHRGKELHTLLHF